MFETNLVIQEVKAKTNKCIRQRVVKQEVHEVHVHPSGD